nr:immunoglobulin light chain junction region [Macaca mulatta]
ECHCLLDCSGAVLF